MSARRPSARTTVAARLAGLVVAVTLTACANRDGAPEITGTIPPTGPVAQAEIRSSVDAWGRRYASRPEEKETILNYSLALRTNSQTGQAVEVLRKGMIKLGGDRDVAAAYGKALAANGDFAEALKVVRSTNPLAQPDWRLLSTEGAILDQTGDHAGARRAYGEALKIVPDETTVLNNLAMSYVLTNELASAEETLRRAAATARVDTRVRQNLALVLALQGKHKDAETTLRAELSAGDADGGVTYLKSLSRQKATWEEIKAARKSPAGTPPRS